MNFKALSLSEFDSVIGLLQESNLEYSDLKQPNIRLFRFDDAKQTIGVGGLEIYGDQALLRSVAVNKQMQKKGLGTRIVAHIGQQAKNSGISRLFLLTTTAREFFESLGYQLIKREDFPKALKQTEQFLNRCPVSAHCMMKIL